MTYMPCFDSKEEEDAYYAKRDTPHERAPLQQPEEKSVLYREEPPSHPPRRKSPFAERSSSSATAKGMDH